MKLKVIQKLLLLVLCAVLAQSTVQAAEYDEATIEQATAEYASKAPVIDAKIDEIWGNTPRYYGKFVVNTSETGASVNEEQIKKSYAQILWNEEFLYLLGVVYDTTLLAPGFTDWNSVDYWISEKDTQNYGWDCDQGDYCYCIADDGTLVSLHGDKTVIPNTEKSSAYYDDYYVVEIKIPWQSDVSIGEGHKIGFMVSFNDDVDYDGKRDAYVFWEAKAAEGPSSEYWNNTSALVSVKLTQNVTSDVDNNDVDGNVEGGSKFANPIVIGAIVLVVSVAVVGIFIVSRKRKGQKNEE